MKKLLLIMVFLFMGNFAMASSGRHPDELLRSNARGAINVLVANYGYNVRIERQKEARTLLNKMLNSGNSRWRKIALGAFDDVENEIRGEYNKVIRGERKDRLDIHQSLLDNIIIIEKEFGLK